MKFKLEIKCDNSAFEGTKYERALEVSRILKKAAMQVYERGAEPGDLFLLYDINGNRVGEAKVTK